MLFLQIQFFFYIYVYVIIPKRTYTEFVTYEFTLIYVYMLHYMISANLTWFCSLVMFIDVIFFMISNRTPSHYVWFSFFFLLVTYLNLVAITSMPHFCLFSEYIFDFVTVYIHHLLFQKNLLCMVPYIYDNLLVINYLDISKAVWLVKLVSHFIKFYPKCATLAFQKKLIKKQIHGSSRFSDYYTFMNVNYENF